jgi:hypothetical protein
MSKFSRLDGHFAMMYFEERIFVNVLKLRSKPAKSGHSCYTGVKHYSGVRTSTATTAAFLKKKLGRRPILVCGRNKDGRSKGNAAGMTESGPLSGGW